VEHAEADVDLRLEQARRVAFIAVHPRHRGMDLHQTDLSQGTRSIGLGASEY
jgi:hypothetical protein